MSLKKKTIRNLQFVGLAQLLSIGLMQIGYLVLARMLAPDDFGLYSAVLVVFNLVITVTTLGLNQAAIQSREESGEMLRTAASFRLAIAVPVVSVVVLAAPFVSSFYGQPEMADPLRVVMIAVLIATAGFVPTVQLSRALRFKELSVSRISSALAWPVVAIIAAGMGFSYWSMIMATLVGSTVAMCVLWAYAPWRISFHIDKPTLLRLLRFGRFPLATGLLVFLFFNLDKVVVGRLLGVDQLGLYFLAFTWGTMTPNFLSNVVNNVMFPTYATISHKAETLSKSYSKTLSYLGYISLPIGFGLAAISHPFIYVLLGAEWAGATEPLAVLSLVGVCSALTSPAGSLFLATGNPQLSWRQSAVTFVSYVILLVPCVLIGGILGVSILMLAITLVSLVWVLHMASGLVETPLRKMVSSLWKPAVAASTMGGVIFLCSGLTVPSFASLVALVGIGVALYSVLIYGLNRNVLICEVRSLIRLVLR